MDFKNLKTIGKVESCYLDKFGTPRQPGLVKESFAKITLDAEFQPEESLAGLEEFDYIWVLFWFHQNTNLRFHAKVHPPRLLGETRGVFATRSPHRPNPIGLSLVKLEKIEGNSLLVSGIDLVNGTPVLDIKPYLPFVESIPEARAGWAEKNSPQITVLFNEKSDMFLQEYETSSAAKSNIKKLIIETLKLDPRPVIYRGFEEGKEAPYRQQHAVRIIDVDVHFEFLKKDIILVYEILSLNN